MTPIVLTSKVGPDGELHLTLPLIAADQDVQVTVEPIAPKKQGKNHEPYANKSKGR